MKRNTRASEATRLVCVFEEILLKRAPGVLSKNRRGLFKVSAVNCPDG